MRPPVQSAPVEPGRLRELLMVDCRSAGEARDSQRFAPLTTVAYSMPWHIKAKRRWRGDRRLRITSYSLCLALAGLVVLWQAPLWNAPSALSREPQVGSAVQTLRALPLGRRAAGATRPVGVSAPAPREPRPARVQPAQQPAASGSELSPRRRLQRADLWLRTGTQRGAREARSLIESALVEIPRDAHGQAALAKACLALGDQGCARAAIGKAMQARPWRAGYRVISRQIDAALAAPRPRKRA